MNIFEILKLIICPQTKHYYAKLSMYILFQCQNRRFLNIWSEKDTFNSRE
ncbi:hypothetical protein pb186bvf_014441 [Paramecium bursaria]